MLGIIGVAITILGAVAVGVLGVGLAFILYDEYVADLPRWAIKYLAWLLPKQGWGDELEGK